MPEFVDSDFVQGIEYSTVRFVEYYYGVVGGVCAEVGVSHGVAIEVRVDRLCVEGGVLWGPPSRFTVYGGRNYAWFFTLCILVTPVHV